MRVTAKLAYGLDALVDLAAAGRPLKGGTLAGRHGVSKGFLENILAELRRAGIVASKRGGQGGYWLARPAEQITVADVIRVLDGASNGALPATGTDGLAPVWASISQATMAAAEAITLDAAAAARSQPPNMKRDSSMVWA